MSAIGKDWRNGERDFLEKLYAILRSYQDGTLKGNSTTVGQLDQPLTGVAGCYPG